MSLSVRQRVAGWLLPAFYIGLTMLLIATGVFLRKYFGPVLPDQVLYHLQQGGIDHSDPRLISRGLRYFAMVVLATVVLVLVHRRLPNAGRWALALVLLGSTWWSMARAIDSRCIGREGDYLAEHYVDPATLELKAPSQKPDVLIVFVESLETAHARGTTFGGSLTPLLASLQRHHGVYGDMRGLGGASWTMGGMFSTLCGLPLQAVGIIQHNAYEYSERFFSNGRCMTDLLAAQGYEATFYGGASLKFAGKGKFLQAHGVERRFGAEEWRDRGIDVPVESWGLPDTRMLEEAWKDMQRPRITDAEGHALPRLDIVLTVDSHPPGGIVDTDCKLDSAASEKADGERTSAQVLRRAFQCTDKALELMLTRWARRSDGRDKVLLVQGDHLSMRGALEPELQAYARQSKRTIFHAVARFDGKGKALPPIRYRGQREFTHVDLMPTLLAEAGFQWNDSEGRMGMGTSMVTPQGKLQSADQHPTLAEREGFEQMDGRLACQSPKFASLW